MVSLEVNGLLEHGRHYRNRVEYVLALFVAVSVIQGTSTARTISTMEGIAIGLMTTGVTEMGDRRSWLLETIIGRHNNIQIHWVRALWMAYNLRGVFREPSGEYFSLLAGYIFDAFGDIQVMI